MKNECLPDEVSLKSFFLGPQAENGPWVKEELIQLLERWFKWRRQLNPQDGMAISDQDRNLNEFQKQQEKFSSVLKILSQKFEQEVPKHSPRYIGHMFSESSLPALFGHFVTLMHNPNNISEESSLVGVKIEEEAIQMLHSMIRGEFKVAQDITSRHYGHFTSGGTVANFEALYRAYSKYKLAVGFCLENPQFFSGSFFSQIHQCLNRFDQNDESVLKKRSDDSLKENPWSLSKKIERIFNIDYHGPVFLIPKNKHYSWVKGLAYLGLGEDAFWPINLDKTGRLCINHLKELIIRAEEKNRPIAMVVSVVGTTELGMIDPVHRVQEILESYKQNKKYAFWHHIDGAYGGHFAALLPHLDRQLCTEDQKALRAIGEVHSITIDPHKLGYVPYSCGAILVNKAVDYFLGGFSAPYVQFDGHYDRGPFTLEGSRSAAGAVAVWTEAMAVGLGPDGLGKIIERTIRIQRQLCSELLSAPFPHGIKTQIINPEGTNIICFLLAKDNEPIQATNRRTEKIFQYFSVQGPKKFFVSKTKIFKSIQEELFKQFIYNWHGVEDDQSLGLIRLTIMNPFFNSKVMQVKFSEEFIKELVHLMECEGS